MTHTKEKLVGVKLSLEQADNGEYYGLIRGENNEALWRTTDTYPEKRDAEHAIDLLGLNLVILDKTEGFDDPAHTEQAKRLVLGDAADEQQNSD